MSILSGLGDWLAPPPLDPALRSAIERAVVTVDPLLKSVSGYERKLAPAVGHALGYCAELAAAIPGPVAIHARAFSDDPLVHAFFAASGDIGEMLGKSREVRAFLADPSADDGAEFFSLLGMRRREKAVMGVALHGDGLRNDVPKRLLYFADHTLGGLAPDCQTARLRLREAAFEGLAKGFATHVADLRRQREEARIAWTLAQGGGADGHAERREELEERQRQTIAALAPESLLDGLAVWLAAPEQRLYLKPGAVSVDRMGVMAPDKQAGENFSTLNLPELVARDRRQWTVVVVRIARQDALDAQQQRQEANRYLII